MNEFLSSFIVVFIGSTVATVLAAWVVTRLDRAFRPPTPRSEAAAAQYSRPMRLRVAAYLVHAVWVGILAMVLLVFAAAVDLVSLAVGLGLLVSVGLGTVLYFCLVLTLRCDACGRRVLVQAISNPPYAERWHSLNPWGSVVTRIVFQGRFRCMYCGQEYLVAGPASPVISA
jgi:hypothetical protein